MKKYNISNKCNNNNRSIVRKQVIFQHKGALLILIWSLTCFSVILYPGYAAHSDFIYYFAACIVTLPIAGWLADVYFGRYKIIRYSMRLMFASLIIYNTLLVTEPYIDKTLAEILRIVTASALAIGWSGVAANIIQFGVDQLTDASSSELSSYISWLTWAFFLSSFIISISQSCSCQSYDTSTTFLIFPLLCTSSVVSDLLLNHWLVKEPVTHNPLKLIYQVLRYAVKNKYPRLRSAFTYWEDKPYYRIDLGKAKYGGPFTTEQVEDVKTFFRILVLIGSFSVILGLIILLGQSVNNMMYHFKDDDYIPYCEDTVSKYMRNCYSRKAVTYFGDITIVILVPVLEIVSHSQQLKRTCFPYMGIMRRILLGLLLLLLFEVLLLVVEVTGVTVTQNHNVTCLLNAGADDLLNSHVLDLSNKWLLLPQFVSGAANYVLLQSGLEFLCAQSPYSMRGLLFGALWYTLFLITPIARLTLQWVARLTSKGSLKNCGIWYYIALMVFTLSFIGSVILLKKCYSLRRRDENLHNEQMFAVNYYDKYLPYGNTSK